MIIKIWILKLQDFPFGFRGLTQIALAFSKLCVNTKVGYIWNNNKRNYKIYKLKYSRITPHF